MSDFVSKPSFLLVSVFVGGMLSGGAVYADACTYREAIMAMEKGNAVRGLALMCMASRDGDPRAESYLRDQNVVLEFSTVASVVEAIDTGVTQTNNIQRPLKTASILQHLRD